MLTKTPVLMAINKQRYLYSFILGAVGALAYPPIGWFWVVFITIPAFMYILRAFSNETKWRCFAVGWWFGFGHFLASLYWIANALFVDFQTYFWLYPFALIGIPAAEGVYIGIISLLVSRVKKSQTLFAGSFAILWMLAELIRGKTVLAFPWNLIGHIWSQQLEVLQITYYIGIYGLSLLTIVAICLVYWGLKKHLWLLPIPVIIFAGIYKFGYDRLAQNPTQYIDNAPLYRLVQPGIRQQDTLNSASRFDHFEDLLLQSIQPKGKPDLIIWPESGVTFLLAESPEALDYISKTLPQNTKLIAGVARREFLPDNKYKVYNSAIVIDNSKVIAKFDKFHLVPFGEYLPLRSIIPKYISKITMGEMDYSPGPGPETVHVPNIPSFSPLICFEAIFSGEVVDKADKPQWLLNLTNDAWYGNSSGPYQHLYSVRIRAIEEGLPLVRVANTGISAVFDAYGRLLHSLPYDAKGTIDFHLPKPAR